MKSYRPLTFIVLSAFLGLFTVPAAVADNDDKGLEIAREMKRHEAGFENYTADMRMVLIDVNGDERERVLRVKTRELENDGDQSLAVFEMPADVKGTAFLSYTHINKDDDQWLYLPSLKRVKRISARNRTAPFMGSEFSYEDLASTEVEEYTYQYIGDEACPGQPCYVLDRFPLDAFSAYSRQRVWVEKTRYLTIKIDYYDLKDRKLKTLVMDDYKQYLNRFWRAGKLLMENHLSGKKTVLYWENYQFRQALTDADFSPSSLTRSH